MIELGQRVVLRRVQGDAHHKRLLTPLIGRGGQVERIGRMPPTVMVVFDADDGMPWLGFYCHESELEMDQEAVLRRETT